MKLIFAVLYVPRTMSLTHYYKTAVINIYYYYKRKSMKILPWS